MTLRPCALVTALIIGAVPYAPGAAQSKAFEVVSVKPTGRLLRQPSSSLIGTSFHVVDITPARLIARAFGVENFQVDAPEWAVRDSFEIRAVVPGGTTERDIPEMLRLMLADRFRVTTHVEKRARPVYELVIAPSGIRMTEAAAVNDLRTVFPEDPDRRVFRDVITGAPGDELRQIISAGGSIRYVTSKMLYDWDPKPPNGAIEITATRMTMSALVMNLGSADRPVIDRTGLGGLYQFKILLPPPAVSPAMRAVLGDKINDDPTGVSLTRSLEQLGLRLRPNDASIDIVVVDHIEQPTPD